LILLLEDQADCYRRDAPKPFLARPSSFTLPQLCQNDIYLCVRIGKIDRLRPPLNAWIDTNSDRW
jgi:hypothetical protein